MEEMKRQIYVLQEYKDKNDKAIKQVERLKMQFAHSEKIR